jgi:hypothetical protein
MAPMAALMANAPDSYNVTAWIVLVLSPPLMVLLIGWSIAWALRGFSNRD